MGGIVLHSDLNAFYASVEVNEDPRLRGKKVAVCGSTENRHGIVLTATYPAKRSGVKTGMANWQAKQACPDLIVVPPRYDLYLKYSRLVHSIYARFCNDIEPFGMDESWLKFEGVHDVEKDGAAIGEEIRRTVKRETGLTVSVGVSFNKIFAKLGSDLKKPDAVTVISEGNFREKIWPLDVSELLYVGPATTRKLLRMGVCTIGQLADMDPEILRSKFGVNGIMLWRFACGADTSPVMPSDFEVPIKSVGHGTTFVRDLETDYDIWVSLYELAQDVGHRLREYGLTVQGVQVTVRDNELQFQQYQRPLAFPTQSPLEIAQTGFALFRERYGWPKPVRAVTIRGIRTAPADAPAQFDMFNDWEKRDRRRRLDDSIDEIRRRFGYDAVRPASLMGKLYLATDRCETVQMPGAMYR